MTCDLHREQAACSLHISLHPFGYDWLSGWYHRASFFCALQAMSLQAV